MEEENKTIINFSKDISLIFVQNRNKEERLVIESNETYSFATLYLIKPSNQLYVHHTLSNEFTLDYEHVFDEVGNYNSVVALYTENDKLVKLVKVNISIVNTILRKFNAISEKNITAEELMKNISLLSVTSGAFETSKYAGVRGLRFNWWQNGQNISGNYTDIGWNFVGCGGGTTWYYTLNGYLNVNGSRVFTQSSSKVQLSDGTVMASGTSRIYHNSDGTKWFSADGGATIYNYGTWQTGSGSWELPTIPRQANVTGATDFNDEQNPSISFNNVGGFRINARLEFNGTSIRRDNIPNTGNYTFILTDEERKLLRQKCTGKSMSVRMTLATCINGTTENYWSFQDKTMTIINANPTFSNNNIIYEDTNSETVKVTENNKHIVRNLSNLVVTINKAIAKKEASISKYELTFNGTTKTVSVGENDLGKINLSSDADLSVKVTDSRGIVTTATITVTILDWELPNANITAKRVNNYEDDTKLTVQTSISSVNNKNSIQSIRYRYKKANEETYSNYASISDNKTVTIKIDKLYIWDFQVEIKDKFGTKTYNFQVAKGMPILFIDIEKLSIGINTFPSKDNSLENGGAIYLESGNEVLDYDVVEEF